MTNNNGINSFGYYGQQPQVIRITPSLNDLPVIDAESVEESLRALLDAHDTTTTLDVKNDLRDQGFYALQRDVSDLMRRIADASDDIAYEPHESGAYFVYSLVEPASSYEPKPLLRRVWDYLTMRSPA